jgi:cardiolipin synthase
MTSTVVGIVVASFHVLGLLAVVHVILTGRTAQGTIGWAIGLAAIPYLTLPLYLIFGPYKFGGYVNRRRAQNEALQSIVEGLKERVHAFLPEEEPSPGTHAAEQLAAMPVTRYNDARLLVDGDATFDAILAGIDEAKDYVLVQFYIVRADGLGNALKDRLVAKAKQGVRIWFLYDDVGSKDLPRSYVSELTAAGAHVSSFGRRRHTGASFFDRFRLNFRNHRKIVVVDGRKAWVGGHNVGDDYLGKDPNLSPWRDTHVEVEGPVVMGVQLSFVEDWYWAAGDLPDISWIPQRAASGDRMALVLPTGPADELETCTLGFVHAINMAKQRVWIVSPYFVPDDQVVGAMQLAVLRGVDVRVLTAGLSDGALVWLAGWSYMHETDGAGVKIFHFQDGFLHQKVLLTDGDFCCVGTANFDNRSFRINFEVGILFGDAEFTGEVGRMLEYDFARSTRVTLADLHAKSLWFRLKARVARLFSPIL